MRGILLIPLVVAVVYCDTLYFHPKERPVSGVPCKDGKSVCPDGRTCCGQSNGEYECCPLPNAVCCSDHKHCCPANTQCDVSGGKCMRGGDKLVLDWFKKLPATKPRGRGDASSVMCPDGASECEDGQTCCLLASGKYGCCPIEDAVCCSDHIHCCPQGTTCDLQAKKCISRGVSLGKISMDMVKIENKVSLDKMEGKESLGKIDVDMVKIEEKEFKGVWCSDDRHWCPEGTVCDSSTRKCTRGTSLVMDWFEKEHAMLRSENVVCPDGQSECKTGQTCCKLSSGNYGCCPIPSAVCCSDGRHCCPSGTKCEVSSGKCMRGSISVIDWFEKEPAILRSENVVCPDGQSQCKTGQTCCKLSSGNYGCCPLPKAVCCSDGRHCCPSGTKCEVSSGKCMRGSNSVMDWIEKEPAILRSENVVCPDGQSQCKTGQTCCKLSSGNYGCCPLPKAVCCSDGRHCCPSGTKCEVSSGKCMRGSISVMDWIEKEPAQRITHLETKLKKDKTIMCPDQKTSCPDKNTCCKNKVGNYGCCAYNNAVCCKSGTYCCPKGYICDTLPQICRMPEAKEAWKNTANLFIQNILRKRIQNLP